ncbi:alpha/beta hydrolase fold domain-containing protein [Nocardia sp. R6R-6]|uniref:alpha/beta hydrolase fold domain-containing protein n=1 Tax=Nocardia sp. R6R-6 TaxID=3459303 RepID=UPI00403D67F2
MTSPRPARARGSGGGASACSEKPSSRSCDVTDSCRVRIFKGVFVMSVAQLEKIYELLRARPHFTEPIEKRRRGGDIMLSRTPVPEDVQILPADCDGVPGVWVVPPGVSEKRIVLHLHGGGFMIGSSRTHSEIASRIGRAAQARVLVIDYRLAPENPFPAGLEDCFHAYEWLLESGHEPSDIAVSGDSAGATLMLSALLIAKSKGLPLPACVVGISGWYDLTNSSESIRANGNRDVFVPEGFNDWAAKGYLQDADPRDPLASPMFGDLAGFPPMLIHIGGADRLLDDAYRLHEKLQVAGVDSTLEVWPEMPHAWHVFGQMLSEGLQATERVAEFILEHTRSSSLPDSGDTEPRSRA